MKSQRHRDAVASLPPRSLPAAVPSRTACQVRVGRSAECRGPGGGHGVPPPVAFLTRPIADISTRSTRRPARVDGRTARTNAVCTGCLCVRALLPFVQRSSVPVVAIGTIDVVHHTANAWCASTAGADVDARLPHGMTRRCLPAARSSAALNVPATSNISRPRQASVGGHVPERWGSSGSGGS